MVTINTTFLVPDNTDGQFRMWARKHCIPALAGAGMTHIAFSRVMVETEAGERNYSMRFDSESEREGLDIVKKIDIPESLAPMRFTSVMNIITTEAYD